MSCIRNALLVFVLSGTGAYAELNRLDAISMIESGDNDRAVGGAGEVSRFQIKPRIWRTYSESSSWRDVTISRRVAQRHLTCLESRFLQKSGREASDFDVYVLWNAGPSYYERVGFSPRRVAPVVKERAQRYVNLRQKHDEFTFHSAMIPPMETQTFTHNSPPLAAVGFSFGASQP